MYQDRDVKHNDQPLASRHLPHEPVFAMPKGHLQGSSKRRHRALKPQPRRHSLHTRHSLSAEQIPRLQLQHGRPGPRRAMESH